MVIINTVQQYSHLETMIQKNDSIVLQVNSDVNLHSIENRISLLYIWVGDEEFMLPINHSESTMEFKNIITKKTIWVFDKKNYLHNPFIKSFNVRDLNYSYYLKHNVPFETEKYLTNAHHFYYRVQYDKLNVNDVIPLLKHYEYLKELRKNLQEYMIKNDEIILEVLSKIETNGLQTIDKMVYSEYNPLTSTGRPSNRFGGLNFAALNKTDGSRKQFISRFKEGVLVEFDFDAYHPRLIGDIVGYEFPNGSGHNHLAETYGLSYDEGKALTFKYLYGGITEEIIDNPFFNVVNTYIKGLWSEYKRTEFVESYIYNRRIYKKNLFDMNPNKLFNYMIQLLETENNIKILEDLLSKIERKNSKLILYNYDSFLFDFDYKKDGLEYLKKVKEILECDGKFPTKTTMGDNYHEMDDITEKLND
jgi:hypothetical protein